jgi:Glycosyl transferase family 2
MPLNYNIDYSIVICTYNPDERILKRCLNAVTNLDRTGITTEVIIVDNNSLTPVESLPYVRDFLKATPSAKMIMVSVQGVNYARIAAITEAIGKYIVYFDYDNEPDRNYLQELRQLNAKYPQVASIGPGDVTVDFIDGIEPAREIYARAAFQERHEAAIKFSAVREWQPCYPFGTGLCTYTFLLKEYVSLARQGKFTMPGRKGNELTSGEDTQMVLLCISKGYFAGVSPALQLRHIIPKTRANENYMHRLAYGTALCYETCLLQVFPEHRNTLRQKMISGAKFTRRSVKKFVKATLSTDPDKLLQLVQFIGSNASVYLALHKPLPPVVKRIIKYLKLA